MLQSSQICYKVAKYLVTWKIEGKYKQLKQVFTKKQMINWIIKLLQAVNQTNEWFMQSDFWDLILLQKWKYDLCSLTGIQSYYRIKNDLDC